jgi:hypothetical protein
VAIKNGPPRDTGKNGHITRDEDKQKKKHNTKTKKIRNLYIKDYGVAIETLI